MVRHFFRRYNVINASLITVEWVDTRSGATDINSLFALLSCRGFSLKFSTRERTLNCDRPLLNIKVFPRWLLTEEECPDALHFQRNFCLRRLGGLEFFSWPPRDRLKLIFHSAAKFTTLVMPPSTALIPSVSCRFFTS